MNKLGAVFLIIIVGIICYANSFNNEFVWDDEYLVVNNEYIRNFRYIPQIFTSHLFKFSYEPSTFYRPIQTLSYLIDYSSWKLNPFGYHLTNLLLHICNALLIYIIISLISGNKKIPLITSLLFVVHPIHTEAVTYISGRADLLVAFFILLSLFSFSRSKINEDKWKNDVYYISSVFCFILALLSKEIALIFPVVLMLFSYCFNFSRERPKFKTEIKYQLPFIVIAFFYVYLRLFVFNFLEKGTSDIYISSHIKFFTFPKVVLEYFSLLFLPFNLHMERFIRPATLILEPQVFASLIFLILIFIFTFRICRSSKLIFFSSLFFFINLLPVSNIIPLSTFIAEHWLYLPSIGFFTIIGIVVTKASEVKNILRQIILFSFIVILIFYSILTIKQNTYWKDRLTFCTYTLSHSPNSYKLYLNLGNLYKDLGFLDKAEWHFKRAIQVKPDYTKAHNSLADLYDSLGLLDKAIEHLKKAIEIKPNHAMPYNNLGIIYDKKGLFNKAISAYKKAIEIKPDYAEVYNNLGTSYRKTNLFDEAIKHYNRALQLKPNYAEPHNNLGTIYDKKGLWDQAIEEYKKAIKIDSRFSEAYNNLGVTYARKGEMEKAIEQWKEALGINPNYKSAQKNLERAKEMFTK